VHQRTPLEAIDLDAYERVLASEEAERVRVQGQVASALEDLEGGGDE
jgi:hypothetical protein